jgi:hypothetical protein
VCRRGGAAGGGTLQACWDADRLDLGRVGITPQPHRLCTDAARSLIPWSHARAIADFEPTEVLRSWGGWLGRECRYHPCRIEWHEVIGPFPE